TPPPPSSPPFPYTTLFRSSAIASGLYGSTRTAALPATSGSDDTFDVTTGVPLAIASSGGSPKPSYSDGNTNTPARRYMTARVSRSEEHTSELQSRGHLVCR